MSSDEKPSIHIGEAGIQIGNACWELFCLEHGINPHAPTFNESKGNTDHSFDEFFKKRYKPTPIFVYSASKESDAASDYIRKGILRAYEKKRLYMHRLLTGYYPDSKPSKKVFYHEPNPSVKKLLRAVKKEKHDKGRKDMSHEQRGGQQK